MSTQLTLLRIISSMFLIRLLLPTAFVVMAQPAYVISSKLKHDAGTSHSAIVPRSLPEILSNIIGAARDVHVAPGMVFDAGRDISACFGLYKGAKWLSDQTEVRMRPSWKLLGAKTSVIDEACDAEFYVQQELTRFDDEQFRAYILCYERLRQKLNIPFNRDAQTEVQRTCTTETYWSMNAADRDWRRRNILDKRRMKSVLAKKKAFERDNRARDLYEREIRDYKDRCDAETRSIETTKDKGRSSSTPEDRNTGTEVPVSECLHFCSLMLEKYYRLHAGVLARLEAAASDTERNPWDAMSDDDVSRKEDPDVRHRDRSNPSGELNPSSSKNPPPFSASNLTPMTKSQDDRNDKNHDDGILKSVQTNFNHILQKAGSAIRKTGRPGPGASNTLPASQQPHGALWSPQVPPMLRRPF